MKISAPAFIQPTFISSVVSVPTDGSKSFITPGNGDRFTFSQQAQTAARATEEPANESVRVSASTGQSKAKRSLTEEQAIALYRKVSSLI